MSRKVKELRWIILSLIALVTVINILDRGTLNYMWKDEVDKKTGIVIQPGIANDLGLIDQTLSPEEQNNKTKEMLALVNIFFMLAYGVSQLLSGRVYDKIGTRKGFVLSAILWGGAVTLTAIVKGLKSLVFFRILLGLGEAGPWPGTTKSNAEWFPVKERAFAQGVFGAASSVGNILVPVIIPLLFLSMGWRATFIVLGAVCLLWIIPWIIINKASPEKHPWITDAEKDYILQGRTEISQEESKTLSMDTLLKDKKSYSIILSRLFLDPVWWMFMTWLPIYLQEAYGLSIIEVTQTAWIPFVGAAVGGLTGGWLPARLIGAKNYDPVYARKISIAIGCIIILPGMIGAIFAPTAFSAALMVMLILGGFQFAMTNIQTLPSDFHSGKTVGTLAGMGGASAVVGIIISTYLVPHLTTGSNWTPFFVMGILLIPLSMISVFLFTKNIAKQSHDSQR